MEQLPRIRLRRSVEACGLGFFFVSDRIRLTVFGNLYLRDIALPSMLLLRCCCLAAVVDSSQSVPSVLVKATLSVDVGEDDGTECDDNYVEQGDRASQRAEDTTSDKYCCIGMDATDVRFCWKRQVGG
jgi:hypothetical protein